MCLKPNKLKIFGISTTSWTVVLLTLTFVACTSGQKPRSRQKAAGEKAVASNAPTDNHFDGGTYCVQTLLQGPPPAQPLRFSNKVTESDQSLKSKDFEADLVGDTVDLVHQDRWLATDQDRAFLQESAKFDDPKLVTHVITPDGIEEETVRNHVLRSDVVSWRGIATGIAQGGTPWHLFLNKPPVHSTGTDNINGFETMKYAVDTTQQDSIDKGALKAFAHLQDYNITGTAWVLKDANCVLQYDITYEETSNDGKSRKTHYEGAVTRK